VIIYLLRHGDAPYNIKACERSLSLQGKIDTQNVIRQHLSELAKLQLIVCSTTLRSKQTLQVLSDALDYTGEVLLSNVLCSSEKLGTVEIYINQLISSRNLKSILLLSNQPLIGAILEYITDQKEHSWSMNASTFAAIDAASFSREFGSLKSITHSSFSEIYN
jgi:phosphohistidine phosphatase SixA